jgi:DNA-binding SARP family transcriptional activator/TolB-like protein
MTVPAAPPLTRLRLLGRFSAMPDGEPSAQLKISSKKGVALVAYLALHPEHSVSREKIATLLWGDRPDRQARLNLRQVILALRKNFATASHELIALDGEMVGLHMDRISVDALEFQKLCRSSDPADIERAALLYGGTFLSELDVETEEFDDWLQSTRARFEAEAARVLEGCAERCDADGRGALAIDAAERLVALDPLREGWQQRLLGIYARHRGTEAALAHARTFVALLKKELDVDPEPSTSALIEDIRCGAIQPMRTELPVPLIANGGGEALKPMMPAPSPVVWANEPALLPAPVIAPVLPARWSASLWRAGAGALWFVVPVSVLFIGALFLGNPRLTPLRGGLAASEVASITKAWSEPPPVVVLPFEAADNRSGDIAELMSDDVIDELSRVPNLRVISRLTSHQYWQTSRDIADVGNRLNVRFAVHGSVKTGPDKWHVNVELIDVANREQVWSDQFDQGTSDSSEAAGMIANQLGRALQVAVIKYQAARGDNLPSAKQGVDVLVAQGWGALALSSGAEGLAAAETKFSEALRRDPDRIGAVLGLAAHHVIALAMITVPEREPYISEAETLLAHVMARRAGSSPAYYYLAIAQIQHNDPQAALISLQTSVKLNPGFAPGHALMGRVLTMLGEHEAALQSIQHARSLSPKDPGMPRWDVATGLAELELGHDQAAIEWISHGVMANAETPFAQIALAAAYAQAGDQPDAELHLARFRELTPNFSNEQRLSYFPEQGQGPQLRFIDRTRQLLAKSRQANSK